MADQAAPDGAYGPLNQAWEQGTKDHWLIEEQRYAIDAVIAGVAYHRQDLISRGEAVFNWGFRQERSDGSFNCPDRFHSMSFFVEAAAHAALLLQASDMAAQNQDWVAEAAPKLRLTSRNSPSDRALTGRQVVGDSRQRDAHYAADDLDRRIVHVSVATSN